MDVYFAKSPVDGFQETVSRHVQKVSALAGAFAAAFGCAEEGRLAGLFHDYGKYSHLFQQVLKQTACHVNHAAPGALYLKGYCRNQLRAPRRMYDALGAVVAAHHSQLEMDVPVRRGEDGLVYDRAGLVFSLSDPAENAASMRQFLAENGSVLPREPLQAPVCGSVMNEDVAYLFFVRMLFSCLVDADYSVSAQDDRLDAPPCSATPPLRTRQLLENMERYRQELKARSTADANINRLREELFQNCVEAAAHAPGLFTLSAPTGLGKTLALFAFALHHAARFGQKRIFIVLPYLSIIKQNADIYRALAGKDLLEDHSQSRLSEEMRGFAERWSSPITVTTSVKFFESLFASYPTDCRKLHHLAQSVIVFDEAQSLPYRLTGVTLETVNALCSRYGCSVVFSTATQPAFDARKDVVWRPTEIVRDPARLYRETKRVETQWRLKEAAPLEMIADELAKEPSCCVIVNMRRHARTLFGLLSQRVTERDGLFFLTTDLCAAHRDAVLDAIHTRMQNGLPCRLVATQCVEAGVDLDFPVVYRALAPLSSIVQAAGRCNRNGRGHGRFVVFVPQAEETGRLYPDDFYGMAAGCVLTLAARHAIDLNDPAHLREYDTLLFEKGGGDDPKLLQAVADHDFPQADARYRLIEKQGRQVVVPYDAALFASLRAEAVKTGLSRAWMARAQPMTVSSYDRKTVEDRCDRVRLFQNGRSCETDTGWFLLGNPADYDPAVGLRFSAGFDGII